jgi:alpha-beta hydrolase superfamily lysophospholipase
MIKLIGGVIGILMLLYMVICLLFYLFQERFLFFPQKLPKDSRFSYPYKFKEYFIEVEEGVRLNALLFKAETLKDSRGLIFYLHGNAGALNSWGYAADEFLQEGYDVFILDYRGYGKSEGKITSQKQLFQDVEQLYLEIQKLYKGQEIIIAGFSIGSGPATWLASRYQPDMLILMAPFYNMTELANHYFPFLPSFILRYPFNNNKLIQKIEAPVVLIHGKEDEIIPYESSLKLKEHLKSEVHLFGLERVGHNNISGSTEFKNVVRELLSQ